MNQKYSCYALDVMNVGSAPRQIYNFENAKLEKISMILGILGIIIKGSHNQDTLPTILGFEFLDWSL
jgi:hypothetical protein